MKRIMWKVFSIVLIAIVLNCGGIKEFCESPYPPTLLSGINEGEMCIGRTNDKYHKNYFEICGNKEKPIKEGRDKNVTLWIEVDSPFNDVGIVWIDDTRLLRF